MQYKYKLSHGTLFFHSGAYEEEPPGLWIGHCTKRSCDVIFMKMKVMILHSKNDKWVILNKIIVSFRTEILHLNLKEIVEKMMW